MERFEFEVKAIESDVLIQKALFLRPEITQKSTSQHEM
jgi:hypothetical protein